MTTKRRKSINCQPLECLLLVHCCIYLYHQYILLFYGIQSLSLLSLSANHPDFTVDVTYIIRGETSAQGPAPRHSWQSPSFFPSFHWPDKNVPNTNHSVSENPSGACKITPSFWSSRYIHTCNVRWLGSAALPQPFKPDQSILIRVAWKWILTCVIRPCVF